jgi:hypothetical protein
LVALASLLLPLTGCGAHQGRSYTRKLIPVKGTITYKGKPLTKGTIRFEPDAGRKASGAIRPDGTFVLSTVQPGDGAVPGVHRVAVTAPRRTIPGKFSNFSLSQIEVEVKAGQTDYPIDLK